MILLNSRGVCLLQKSQVALTAAQKGVSSLGKSACYDLQEVGGSSPSLPTQTNHYISIL